MIHHRHIYVISAPRIELVYGGGRVAIAYCVKECMWWYRSLIGQHHVCAFVLCDQTPFEICATELGFQLWWLAYAVQLRSSLWDRELFWLWCLFTCESDSLVVAFHNLLNGNHITSNRLPMVGSRLEAPIQRPNRYEFVADCGWQKWLSSSWKVNPAFHYQINRKFSMLYIIFRACFWNRSC